MIEKTFFAAVLIVFAFPLFAEEADKKQEQAAVAAAEQWLKGLDEANYANGWKEASAYLRGAVKEDDFAKALQGARQPLGKLVSRKLKAAKYSTELPGAPDGEYFVLQFDTAFENKKAAIETITPMLEKDGQWRVSGYFIK